MHKTNWIVYFLMSVIVMPLVLVIVACGGDPNLIVGRGSNSTTSIVSLINKETIYNLNYTNDGSTHGAREMAKGELEVDFGMTSSRKAPGTLSRVPGIDYVDPNKGLEQEITNWKNNHIRTVTFAIDAIGIGINPPLEVKKLLKLDDNDPSNDIIPIINFESLVKMYSINPRNSSFPTWKTLLINPEIEALSDQFNTQPIALAIEGGTGVSGKSEAFIEKIVNDPWFISSGIDKKIVERHDSSIIELKYQVGDREVDMYNKNKETSGSVMYYSLGYILKNDRKDDVVLANIQNWEPPTLVNAQNKSYPWIRPFNILYSVTNQKALNLVEAILEQSFQDKIKNVGFVPLSQEQIDLQTKTYELNVPDLESPQFDKWVNQDPKLDFGLVL